MSATKQYVMATAEGHANGILETVVINNLVAISTMLPEGNKAIGESVFFDQNCAKDIA